MSSGEDGIDPKPWQCSESLEQSPWMEKIITKSDTTTKIPEWLIKFCVEQNCRVGSLAPIDKNNSDQRTNEVPVEDPSESSNDSTSCQKEVKEERQGKMTHREANHYRMWLGEPWIDS